MRHLTLATLLITASGLAAAHAGHGLAGPHWHASDLFAPSMLLVAIATALLARRNQR
jgi:hypothetical protein